MANFNKVMLMGNLTRDPELRHISGGQTAVCNMGLAVNRRWKDRNTGEDQEETCFVDIVVWGRQAESCNEYLSKGRPVFIEGRLQLDQWEDRDTGANRSKLKVVAERVQFLGGRDDNQGGGYQQRGGGGGRQQQQQRGPDGYDRRSEGRDAPPQQGQSGGYDFDDIPF